MFQLAMAIWVGVAAANASVLRSRHVGGLEFGAGLQNSQLIAAALAHKPLQSTRAVDVFIIGLRSPSQDLGRSLHGQLPQRSADEALF